MTKKLKNDKINEINVITFENLEIISDISKYNELCKDAIFKLMTMINHLICANTDVCYHPNRLKHDDKTIILPITVQYHNDEGNMINVIDTRVKTIKNVIENMTFENNNELYVARIFKKYDIDPFNLIEIRYILPEGSEFISDNITLNLPDVPEPTITEKFYPNLNFRHIEYIDPLMSDYGLYIGLSKDFNQMGYCYNALHIYEHMMTCVWNTLDKSNLKMLNGSTYPTGKCYVYTIHNNPESIKSYANKYIEEHTKSKSEKFWKVDYYEDLKRESIRTYSETQHDRNIKNFARTDPFVYKDMIYNYEPFIKFSQDKYTVLTVGPKHINYNFDKLERSEKTNKSKASEISEQTFNYIPLSAIRNSDGIIILKNKNLEPKVFDKYSILLGNDCVGIVRDDANKITEEINTCLLFILDHPLKDITEFFKNKAMPINNNGFNTIDMGFNILDAYEFD